MRSSGRAATASILAVNTCSRVHRLTVMALTVVALVAVASCAPPPPAVPSATTVLGTVVTAEDMRVYENSVQNLAKQLGIENPPAVELVRFIGNDEAGKVLVECLTAAGIPVKLDSDGLLSINLEPGSVAVVPCYVCMAKYPIDPRYTRPKDAS